MTKRTHPPSLWTGDLPAEVAHNLAQVRGGLAVDTETSGLDWRTDQIALIQVATADGRVHIVRCAPDPPQRLLSLLSDPGIRKVFHHAMFDLRFITNTWRVCPANLACTKVVSKLLRPKDSIHSLKPLLKHYLGLELDKQEQTSDWFAPTLSIQQLAYAAADVIYLHDLLSAMSRDLDRQGLSSIATGCFAHLPTRVALEIGGFPDVFTY